MTKILVVDDDPALSDVIAFTLRRAGMDVFLAHNGHVALDQYAHVLPDLVILDWILPDMDGLDVYRRIRCDSNVPIIMLSVRYTDDDVVTALETGVDEYITKPFSPRQLVARIRALLRRISGEPQENLHTETCSLDVELREIKWPEHTPVHLTRLETHLLEALFQNAGRVLTAESLITRVWGSEGASPDMLKQLIYRLRCKLNVEAGAPISIKTIREEGYLLETFPTN
jgi:DNA-binding response OmpR family regulator